MKTSELIWQDSQHQNLLNIIDLLKNAQAPDIEIIEQLSTYVKDHFSLEEKYMKITGFPAQKAHIKAHRKFEEKIKNLLDSSSIIKLGLENERFKDEISSFLSHWLINHVMGMDKELEDHILKSKFK